MTREELEEEYGQVYDTNELTAAFEVHSFAAPYVSVTEKATEKHGWMMFQATPRFYFGFEGA